MVRRMLVLVAVAIFAYMPLAVRAESTSSTATISVTILPSPLDAAMISDCHLQVVTGSTVATCTGTLLVADPTLELTGWRVKLAAIGFSCTCATDTSLSPDDLTIQSIGGPSFVNGQPIHALHGPTVRPEALGDTLSTPQLVTEADAGYGNGAYSIDLTLRLSVSDNVAEGTYTPIWSITLERQNTVDATSNLFRTQKLSR